jgi:hypothetical protein
MGFEANQINNGASGSGTIYNIRIPLSAAQINTGNSIPIDCGIVCPGGVFINVINAILFFTSNSSPSVQAQWGLKTNGINNNIAYSQWIIGSQSQASDAKCQFNPNASANSIAFKTGEGLLIQTDVDDLTGTGTAVIYIAYQLTTA